MYSTSEEYRLKMQQCDLANSTIKGKITLLSGKVIDIDESNLKSDSVVLNMSCVSGTGLEIGSTMKNELSLSFFSNMKQIYSLLGATVNISFYLGEEEIPLGIFTVAEPERDGNTITIDCYDNMSKIDIPIGNMGTNGTPYNILNWISRNTGVELKNTEAEIKAMTNSGVVLNVASGVFSSYIEVLSEVAQILCGFATIDREGKLEIRQYKSEPVLEIYPVQLSSAKLSDFKCKYTELHADIDSINYVSGTGDGTGLKYTFESKTFNGTPNMISTTLNNIIKTLSGIEYTPASIKMIDDPSLDLGDMITLKADGHYILQDTNILITSYDYYFDGGINVDSTGENPYLQGSAATAYSSSKSSSAIAKNNATYVATFENVEEYEIGDTAINISHIEYTCGSNDICILNGNVVINVKTAGTLEIRYYQNGEENTFIQEMDLTTGKHTIPLSCWFKNEETNSLIPYDVTFTGIGLTGTVSADKVRSYVLGTTTSEGKFITDNVMYETINLSTYTNNVSLLGYEQEG